MHGLTISLLAQPRFKDKWHAYAWQSMPFRHDEVSWDGTSASLGQCSKSHGTWAPVWLYSVPQNLPDIRFLDVYNVHRFESEQQLRSSVPPLEAVS